MMLAHVKVWCRCHFRGACELPVKIVGPTVVAAAQLWAIAVGCRDGASPVSADIVKALNLAGFIAND